MQSTEVNPTQEKRGTSDDPEIRQQVAREARRDALELTNSIRAEDDLPRIRYENYLEHSLSKTLKFEETRCEGDTDAAKSAADESDECHVIDTSQDEHEETRSEEYVIAHGCPAQTKVHPLKKSRIHLRQRSIIPPDF